MRWEGLLYIAIDEYASDHSTISRTRRLDLETPATVTRAVSGVTSTL